MDARARRAGGGRGGHSASLWRSYGGRPAFLGSSGFTEGMRNFARPRDPPYDEACMIATARARGFVSDAEPETQARLKHVAFYQDVMVRYDFPWRAGVHLDGLDSLGGVHRLFWRDNDVGPFSPTTSAILNASPPPAGWRQFSPGIPLRVSLSEMPSRSSGVVRRCPIDPRGFVKALNAAAERSIGHRGLAIVDGRLSSLRALERHRIEMAVGASVSEKPVPGSVLLGGSARSGRSLLVVLPVVGAARDVFGATKALAVLIDLDRSYRVNPVTLMVLTETFRLTEREAEVAVLIAQNRSPIEIAGLFGSAEGRSAIM